MDDSVTINQGTTMLHYLRGMIGYAIRATDGDLGTFKEIYFDDANWVIRYLIVETSNWLFNRKVLISPVAFGEPEWTSRTLPVHLSREQVRNSPDIDTERPVCRQHEVDLNNYYKWPVYWGDMNGNSSGISYNPQLIKSLVQEKTGRNQHDDPHLRSSHEIIGYGIHATDGVIGHVVDFVVDTDNWTLAYIIVDTGNWFFERKLLITVASVTGVNWADNGVHLDCTRDVVKNSPEFDPSKTILHAYEEVEQTV